MAASEDGVVEQVIELLRKYAVDRLDGVWVRNVIDSDFTEVEDLPSAFEEIHCSTNFSGLFRATLDSLRHWVDTLPIPNTDENDKNQCFNTGTSTSDSNNADEYSRYSKFWIDLSENTNTKSLLALMFFYIHRGQRYDAKEEGRELGVQASSLYFLLLCVPGSSAFRIFHPVLYLKALDVMRLTTKLNLSASSQKKRPNSNQSGKGNQRQSHDIIDQEEDEEGEIAMLTTQEANRFVRSLNILLHDFLRFVQRFSLKRSPETLDETVSILVDVTRCETQSAQGIFVGLHGPGSVTALAYNSYVSLQHVCSSLHGNPKKIVTLVMKHILVNILMIGRGSSQLSWRSLGVIREHSLIFIKYLLTQLKESTYDSVYILVQHLCVRVPDKADYRTKTAHSVVEILKFLPIIMYTNLVKWLYKFSHNEKAGHRLFVLEVISKMLGEEERNDEGKEEGTIQAPPPTLMSCNEEDQIIGVGFDNVTMDQTVVIPNHNYLSHKFLLSIIFSRCRDSAATVRSKALSLLAECTLSANPTIMCAMKEIFFKTQPEVFTTPCVLNENTSCELPQGIKEETTENDIVDLPNATVVMSMLRRRALDDKVTVRKSALQVMENLMRLDSGMLSVKNLKVLAAHCRDPALLVRKQMITSLTLLLDTYPEHDDISSIWVSGVLPLVLDPEAKVQEKVVEVLDQLLFSRLLPYHKYEPSVAAQQLPWLILENINKQNYHKFFKKAVMLWTKSELVRKNMPKMVYTHVGYTNNDAAWMLLGIVSQYLPIKDTDFILDYYEQHTRKGVEVGTYAMQQVLFVLCNSIKYVPENRLLPLQKQLLDAIAQFRVEAELISPIVDIITLLSYTMDGEDENGHKAIVGWAGPILKSCDEYLKQLLFASEQTDVTEAIEEKMFRYLYTMGEMAMLCPSKVNRRMFLSIQSIIFHQSCSSSSFKRDDKFDGSVRVSTTQNSSSQPQAITFTPTQRLQALAIVTLGKMCLQHEDQAKKIIPALGKMLDTDDNPTIKTNIIFVLSDMCVRYATLVDPLMPQITACLRDPNIQVRRTTLTLLINLLQEDYLKLKGSFFYRILQCLTDDQEDIRDTVIFYITQRLLKRFPKILCQHFIECIFHYNCYEEHESYNRFCQSKQEKDLFSLAGAQFKEERMKLYRFMLDHMPDDQRFTTTQRLCQDVLGGVVDGRIRLTQASLPMLEDTLMVLSCDEIKLASLKARTEDVDHATDEAEQAAMAGMVIKKTIISQVVKRNVIENIVPILMALKHKLEENKSSLMRHLLRYLKELMKDYKNEVKEILAGDKQLAKEIDFDLRRLDKEQDCHVVEKDEEQRLNQEMLQNPGCHVQENPDLTGSGSSTQMLNPVAAVCLRTSAKILKQAFLNNKHLSKRKKSIISDNEQDTPACTIVNEIDVPTITSKPTVELIIEPAALEDEKSSHGSQTSTESVECKDKCADSSQKKVISKCTRTENGDNSASDSIVQYQDPRPIPQLSLIQSETPLKSSHVQNTCCGSTMPPEVVNDVTFADQAQGTSSVNTTSSQSITSEKQSSISLPPKDSRPLAKHREFNSPQQSSKDKKQDQSKSSDPRKKQHIKNNKGHGTCGLFESGNVESVTNTESNSTLVNDSASTCNHPRSSLRTKNKRTRDMVSLSPDTKQWSGLRAKTKRTSDMASHSSNTKRDSSVTQSKAPVLRSQAKPGLKHTRRQKNH
ncbi:chromosome associated protein D3 [Oratosquilla oratoria]|uniref:chromosome associated protein D3 n=1 Tax=Oratosquilla oratoria TaxID=337810 RepID=UPI003F766AAB